MPQRRMRAACLRSTPENVGSEIDNFVRRYSAYSAGSRRPPSAFPFRLPATFLPLSLLQSTVQHTGRYSVRAARFPPTSPAPRPSISPALPRAALKVQATSRPPPRHAVLHHGRQHVLRSCARVTPGRYAAGSRVEFDRGYGEDEAAPSATPHACQCRGRGGSAAMLCSASGKMPAATSSHHQTRHHAKTRAAAHECACAFHTARPSRPHHGGARRK